MLDFKISGFPDSNGNPAPTDPVTGTIVWQAASSRDPILSFDSINMTIDGHAYSIGEIGYFRRSDTNWDTIGGTLNGVSQVINKTDDFWVLWNRDSSTPIDFRYTSSQTSGGFVGSIFETFSIPEPTTISLLALCMCGLGARHILRRISA